jgi:hypothetical protein
MRKITKTKSARAESLVKKSQALDRKRQGDKVKECNNCATSCSMCGTQDNHPSPFIITKNNTLPLSGMLCGRCADALYTEYKAVLWGNLLKPRVR